MPCSRRRELLLGLLGGLVGAVAPAAAIVPVTPDYADRILVLKRDRLLHLMQGQTILRTFRVALGRRPLGTKERQGDGRTPEGVYHLEYFKEDSAYHRAIKISYPNDEDRQRARARGADPGGLIMIHGLDPAIGSKWRDSHWMFNWTNGCIAVTNAEMDVIWSSVAPGIPIEIRP